MTLCVQGSWTGWDGQTIVQLSDGTMWQQDEYHYEYHYAYQPRAEITGGKMLVEGMHRAVRVRQVYATAS